MLFVQALYGSRVGSTRIVVLNAVFSGAVLLADLWKRVVELCGTEQRPSKAGKRGAWYALLEDSRIEPSDQARGAELSMTAAI